MWFPLLGKSDGEEAETLLEAHWDTETRKLTAQGAKENDTEKSELKKRNSLWLRNLEASIPTHLNSS